MVYLSREVKNIPHGGDIMKKRNALGWMGFVSLLAILGFLTENKGYFGFLGFVYYFRYFKVVADELFLENIQKSATIAFFCGLIATLLLIPIKIFIATELGSEVVFAAGFVVSLLIFTMQLTYREYKEQSGCGGC